MLIRRRWRLEAVPNAAVNKAWAEAGVAAYFAVSQSVRVKPWSGRKRGAKEMLRESE